MEKAEPTQPTEPNNDDIVSGKPFSSPSGMKIGDGVEKEMPKYQSYKQVWALKIKSIVFDSDLAKDSNRETDGSAIITSEEEGYSPFKVNNAYCHKHKPQVGGYYVMYDDGYESWSPAEAFEGGYIKIIPKFPTQQKNETEN